MTRRLPALLAVALAGSAVGARQTPDRTHPPEQGPPPALRLPAIQKRELSNGVPLWLVELHEVPVVQMSLLVLRGTGDDPPGRFGVASLTAAMLEEGAGARSSLAIADALDFLGADLQITSGYDASAVRLHVPIARFADALPIMADVALRPTFPAEELERVRQQRLTSILQARDSPATIDALAFSRALFGPAHRYGTAAGGRAETIAALGAGDLRSFYQTAFQPSNAALIVVGDVTMDRVLPLVEASFGHWTAAAPAAARSALPEAPEPRGRAVFLVDKPGAAQSEIRIGWVGVPRATPDYFAIQVLNTVLGDSFSSRLNMNLRERHGYTYGAGSVFDMRSSAGPFVAYAGVQTDKTADALREFFNELAGISQPIPDAELSRAKNYIALRYPQGFETTGDISRRLEDAVVYHLPDDYFSTYVRNIETVSAADVQRVARKYIQPGRFLVVITGDRKTIEPAIGALKLGPIETMTLDEVFGPAPKLDVAPPAQ